MAKWEYCMLAALDAGNDGSPQGFTGRITISKGLLAPETISVPEHKRLSGVLHDLGAEGWEAVGFNASPSASLVFLFKRPY